MTDRCPNRWLWRLIKSPSAPKVGDITAAVPIFCTVGSLKWPREEVQYLALCYKGCSRGHKALTFPFQEAIIQIMKMRKRISNAQLQTELVEILKNMFLPQKKMIKEQIEWLIEHKYIKRDEADINTFIYMA